MSSGELTVMFRRTPDVSAKGNHAFGNLVRQMNHVRQTTCVGVSDTPTPPHHTGGLYIPWVRPHFFFWRPSGATVVLFWPSLSLTGSQRRLKHMVCAIVPMI